MAGADTSIYGQQVQPRFNTPFETLGQIGQLQAQQQAIQSAKALEQERQQKLADDQRKQAETDRFNAIIGNPALTPDAFLAQVRTTAPEHFATAQKLIDDARKNAADLAEKDANTKRALAEMQGHEQAYLANQARVIKKAGDTPEAFEMAMKIHEEAFPGSKKPDVWRQAVLQQGPQSIAAITSAMIEGNPAASKQAAEEPEQEARAKLAQLVTAGTSPTGMTADQQAQDANRQAQRGQEQQRIGIEGARLKVEQDKAAAAATVKAAGKQLSQTEADKISDIQGSLRDLESLRVQLTQPGSTGVGAAIGAHLPNVITSTTGIGAEAKSTQAAIDRTRQTVARMIHGGVLRANDQVQAEKFLPVIGDAESVKNEKITQLQDMITSRLKDHLSSLGKAGYNVSNFASADTAEPTKAASASLAPGKVQRVRQNGVTYEVVTDPQGKVISQKVVP